MRKKDTVFFKRKRERERERERERNNWGFSVKKWHHPIIYLLLLLEQDTKRRSLFQSRFSVKRNERTIEVSIGSFFRKWANPGLFLFISVFSNKIQYSFYNKSIWLLSMQYTASGFEPITTIPGLPPKHRKLSPNTFSQNYGLIQLLRNTFLRLKFKTQTRQSLSMMGQFQIKFIRKLLFKLQRYLMRR